MSLTVHNLCVKSLVALIGPTTFTGSSYDFICVRPFDRLLIG